MRFHKPTHSKVYSKRKFLSKPTQQKYSLEGIASIKFHKNLHI